MGKFIGLEYYESIQDACIKHANAKIKRKGIANEKYTMNYNRKLDRTFSKEILHGKQGLFVVIEGFANGTYHLSNLDGTLHASKGMDSVSTRIVLN